MRFCYSVQLGGTRCNLVHFSRYRNFLYFFFFILECKTFCFIYFLLVHRVPPSCTEFHRVPPSYFIFVLYTSYLHRVPPSCTELQRVPPSYFIFALYTSSLHRVPPSYSFLLNILMSCTEYHRY